MSLFLDVLLPTTCLFCGKFGARVCAPCESNVGTDSRLVYREGLLGFSATSYSSNSQKLLRSYKELGESELASVLASSMTPLLGCFDFAPTVLVPVPSNRTSMRERGYNPAELLAREISLRVCNLRWSNLLVRTRETLDQSKLGPQDRRSNQSNSLIAVPGEGRVLLIDDVVTTGATLLEASAALQKSGYLVQGFITFAETEGKRCTVTTQAQMPADGGTSWN